MTDPTVVLTADQVRAFWREATAHYGTRVVDKTDSQAMGAVAWLLDAMGVQDQQRFLTRYATTIGKAIYLPFEVGDDSRWSLQSQVALCCHEHTHVLQQRQDGALRYQWRYATSSADRANYEVRAYAANLEIAYWYDGSRLDPTLIANKFADYGCSARDIAVSAVALRALAQIAWRGGVTNPVVRWALPWWEAQHPAVRISKASWTPIADA